MNYDTITDLVDKSLSSLVNNLLISIDQNVFSILDEIVFLNADTIKDKYFLSFFSKNFNLVSVCQVLLLALSIYYIISYFISLFTSTSYQTPRLFILKLFISAFLIKYSLDICTYILNLFYLLTQILSEIGFSIFSFNLSFSLLYEHITHIFQASLPFNFFTFNGLSKSLISFGFINLLFTYSVRFIFVKILILISPFAFLSLALDQSSWIFKIWLKNLIGQLFTQLFICTVLLIMFSFSQMTNQTVVSLLYLASITCLNKANTFVKDFTSGFTSDVSASLSSIKSIFN